MGDVKSAWKDTGEQFAALGASLKAHFEGEQGSAAGAARPDLGEAARRFAGAVQEAVNALGAAAKDPAVQEDVRNVGTSFAEALSATFAEVAEDLRRMADAASGERGADPGREPGPQPHPDSASGPGGWPSTPADVGAEPASGPGPEPAPPAEAPPAEAPPNEAPPNEAPPDIEPWGTP